MSSYLNLQLLDFGIVDEEGEGFLPQRFMSLILGLETERKRRRKYQAKMDHTFKVKKQVYRYRAHVLWTNHSLNVHLFTFIKALIQFIYQSFMYKKLLQFS